MGPGAEDRSSVHPDARAFLDLVADAPPLDTQDVDRNRADLDEAKKLLGEQALVHAVVNAEVTTSSGAVRVRVYRPVDAGDLPAVAYFHGGGWTLGDLDLCDTTCRALAVGSGAAVVAVDYRLAPEHRFPAAFEDAVDVTTALLDGTAGLDTDRHRVAVAGDSAGGNLAAGVALALRDRPGLRHQALIYPVTQAVVGATASYREFAEDHFLTARDMQYFLDQYAPGVDPTDPRLAPAAVADLSGAPAATVVVAECDPLRDEGEEYARRLAEAGVPVELHRFAGQVHPFVYLGGIIGDAHAARHVLADALRRAFG